MEKEYKKIEFCCGRDLSECVMELIEHAVKGEFVSADFNGHTLYSDTVSMDSACMEVLGKTMFEQAESKRKWYEDYETEKKAHEEAIPELTKSWIEKGHKALSEDKWDLWDKCVPVRLSDLYQGMELGQCLDLVKLLKDKDFGEAKKLVDSQGHSGMSYGLIMTMVKTFSDNGKEFAKYMKY